MSNPRLLEDLLLQMGFTSEDFNSVRRARTRAEAVQRLQGLKARFKVAFRKKVLELHPDHTGGDAAKSEQLQHLLTFARELEGTEIPPEAPRVLIHEVTFHNPIPQARKRSGWSGLPEEIHTHVASSGIARTVAGMRPSGVNRGR